MATSTQIADLRRMVNEPTTTTYSDVQIAAFIDASTSLNAAASTVWTEKAAKLASLVDVKEGSSSRNLGDLYDQALKMAKSFSDAAEASVGGVRNSRTRSIERA